jgi:cytochrome c biogenesis protein CcdA
VKRSTFREIFAYCLGFFIVYYYFRMTNRLFTETIPPANRELIIRIMGGIEGAFFTILCYFFGTSKGSSEKTEMIHETKKQKEKDKENEPTLDK